MTLSETAIVVIIGILTSIYMWARIKRDLKSKSGMTLYDSDGKKISNFGDWLDGKEQNDKRIF
jgi:hypothetical protein